MHKKQYHSIELMFVQHARVQKLNLVLHQLLAEVVAVKDFKQLNKDHSLFNRVVETVMEQAQLSEVHVCLAEDVEPSTVL